MIDTKKIIVIKSNKKTIACKQHFVEQCKCVKTMAMMSFLCLLHLGQVFVVNINLQVSIVQLPVYGYSNLAVTFNIWPWVSNLKKVN